MKSKPERHPMFSTQLAMQNALNAGVAIPAFNIPYLPMMGPVVRARRDQDPSASSRSRAWSG